MEMPAQFEPAPEVEVEEVAEVQSLEDWMAENGFA